MTMVLYCFVGIAAVFDLMKREIPGWLFGVFGIAGVAGNAALALWGDSAVWLRVLEGMDAVVWNAAEGGGIWPVLTKTAASVSVGAALLIVSRLAAGAVGAGDGLFFVVTGLYIPWNVNLGLLCYGLLLCCIYGIVLTALGALKGVSVRKKKIPFLPFVSAAGFLMYFTGIRQI